MDTEQGGTPVKLRTGYRRSISEGMLLHTAVTGKYALRNSDMARNSVPYKVDTDSCLLFPSAPENEIGRADQTEAGPKKIEFEWLLHVENGKRREHGEGDDFLNDFQLCQG